MRILSGIGEVRSYSRPLLATALVHPLAVLVASRFASGLDLLVATAWIFCLSISAVHVVAVTAGASRVGGLSPLALWRPGLPPLLAAVAVSPTLLIADTDTPSLLRLLLAGATFSACYCGLFAAYLWSRRSRRQTPPAIAETAPQPPAEQSAAPRQAA